MAHSTIEAEYIAASEAAKEGVWMLTVYIHIKFHIDLQADKSAVIVK
jgi:hypothetical protein